MKTLRRANIYWDDQDPANPGWAWKSLDDDEHAESGPIDGSLDRDAKLSDVLDNSDFAVYLRDPDLWQDEPHGGWSLICDPVRRAILASSIGVLARLGVLLQRMPAVLAAFDGDFSMLPTWGPKTPEVEKRLSASTPERGILSWDTRTTPHRLLMHSGAVTWIDEMWVVTHKIIWTPKGGQPTETAVMLLSDAGVAYSKEEWEGCHEATWEVSRAGEWFYEGNTTPGGAAGEVEVVPLTDRDVCPDGPRRMQMIKIIPWIAATLMFPSLPDSPLERGAVCYHPDDEGCSLSVGGVSCGCAEWNADAGGWYTFTSRVLVLPTIDGCARVVLPENSRYRWTVLCVLASVFDDRRSRRLVPMSDDEWRFAWGIADEATRRALGSDERIAQQTAHDAMLEPVQGAAHMWDMVRKLAQPHIGVASDREILVWLRELVQRPDPIEKLL